MPDDDLINIKIERVIPAKKWRIIRLITKVEEFPNYIPCVKEAKLISRSRDRMKTKWRIQIDNVPISWVEEDILDLRQNTIYFKAVEGDLEDFRGEWKFRDHPEGTEVVVNVFLKVNIPGIKKFAEEYIKKILIANFETILKSIDQRLVSIKYASCRGGDTKKVAGFGIIGHLYNFYHLEKCLKMLNPDFSMPSREFLGQLFHITPSFKLFDIRDFKSKIGQVSNGCFIVATFIPDMIEKDIWTIFSKVVHACRIAEKQGVGIVTLGGFTSIVAEKIAQNLVNEVDVPVTTGNTFTAAMVIEGVLKAVSVFDMDISRAKLTIVGGTGDIGSGCARVFADIVGQLTITGRTKANLKYLKGELSKKRKAKIIATTDNESAVKDADIVIAAASATNYVLNVDWFKPGSIICDVGYPKNISYIPTRRQDIFMFSGGLTKAPTSISFPIDIGLPVNDIIYGCFAEAIILSLEGRYESFSIGRGNITKDKIYEIKELGQKHGFEVSGFYWGDRLLDEPEIGVIKESINMSKKI